MDATWSGEPNIVLDGKYRIDSLLGQGGMGAVYRATHLGTTRTVAVKVIHPRFSGDQAFVERFRREAEAAGRLRHPNVVDVTDFGFAQSGTRQVAYLVMEYLDGHSLADALDQDGRVTLGSAVEILDQVCSAVGEAHRLGVVHRDIKPDNIWLEPNRRGGFTVKVLDFGLAKLAEADPLSTAGTIWKPGPSDATGLFPAGDSGFATQAGAVTGTPLYMSPEQCRGGELDARSDIYSLGVVAYQLLTGEPPFKGDALELIRLHCDAEPRHLRAVRPALPRRLASVVMEALAKQPDQRPSSADGFAAALRAGAEGSGALLRRAVALYSEHFPTFAKLSLMANMPLIVSSLGVVILDEMTPDGSSTPLLAVSIFMAVIITNLFAYATITAAVVPLVVQLSIAPLRPLTAAAALSALRPRAAAFAASTLMVLLLTSLGLIALVLPGIAFAVWHILYAPIVIVEHLPISATLRRARILFRRVWRTGLVITALQFALPVLVWIGTIDSTFVLRLDDNWQPTEFQYGFSMSSGSMVYQLLNVVVTPLAGIMTAQLYLKARHAGGETLDTP